MTAQLWAIALVIIGDLIGSFASILLKIGSGAITRDLKSIMANYKRTLYLIGGLGLFGLSAIIFTIALRGGELSVLYPIIALSYIWVNLLSAHFLGESLNAFKWTGIASILVGVWMIGWGSDR